MFLQIVFTKPEQNYVNNDYTNFIKSIKMTPNSKQSRQRTQKDKKVSFPKE